MTLRDKVRSCEVRKAVNVDYFSGSGDRSYVVSALCPQCTTKDWRVNSYWLYPRESGPGVVQGPHGMTTSPTLIGPMTEVFRAILAHEAPQRQSRYENERMKSQINNSLHTPYCRIFFFLSHRLAQKVPFDNNTPCNELQIKREPKISTFADNLIPEYPPFKFSALPLFSLRVGVKTLYSTMNLSQ